MTRAFVTVIALFLTAGAAGLIGGGSGFAPTPAPALAKTGETAGSPWLGAAAMIVLTAADTDRGRPSPEDRAKKQKAAPPAEAVVNPAKTKVLPERNQFSDAVVLAVLMAGGFALGVAGFVFGRVWSGIVTAGFSGLAIGAAVYAYAFSSQVAQPNLSIAAALLIFSASALAPNLLGRAGLVAVRRFFSGRRG